MSKLPKEYRFLDFSDYGRPLARIIANSLKETSYTPIDVTLWFIISGIIAIVCILFGLLLVCSFFFIAEINLGCSGWRISKSKKNSLAHR